MRIYDTYGNNNFKKYLYFSLTDHFYLIFFINYIDTNRRFSLLFLTVHRFEKFFVLLCHCLKSLL